MSIQLDHLILAVNDIEKSIQFYTSVLGLTHEGNDGTFAMIRVTPDFMILMAPWGTKGGEHLAFAMPRPEFETIFRRVREAGIEYGDRFDSVGNMKDPGEERGARGMGKSLYFFDPSRHLIEIRCYDA